MLTQRAAMAEFERDTFRERSMGGKVRRALEGVQPARAVSPYWYHIVTRGDVEKGLYSGHEPGTYVVLEDQAYWVRRMYELFDQGTSLRRISAILNDSAVPTQRGGSRWWAATVRSILGNPVFQGHGSYGKQEGIRARRQSSA